MGDITQTWFDRFTVLTQSEDRVVYQIKNESGEGTVAVYDVFPGVTLAFNDFHMRAFQPEAVPGGDILRVDHCREGRLEYAVRNGVRSRMETGDIRIGRGLAYAGRFEMPRAHYRGLTVAADLDAACEALPEQVMDFPVDLRALRQKYCPAQYPATLHGGSSLGRICGELYTAPPEIRRPYYKIKILELLLCMQALSLPGDMAEHPYFYQSQVEKVKSIQRLLAENMQENYTQESLSKQFDIPLTTMKRCFKFVFGASMGSWLTEYRMNQAAMLLRRNEEMSIAEIAGRVGYESPSKFAVAFRRQMAMSPTEYRKK